MKTFFNTLLVSVTFLVLMLIGDAPPDPKAPFGFQLVSEAHAILGVRRRTRRRTAVIVASETHAADAAAAQQQAAASAPPPPPPAAAPPPVASGAKPLGTVVSSLPKGCTPTPIKGIEYQHCGADYYRTAFQGSNLIYVTSTP